MPDSASARPGAAVRPAGAPASQRAADVPRRHAAWLDYAQFQFEDMRLGAAYIFIQIQLRHITARSGQSRRRSDGPKRLHKRWFVRADIAAAVTNADHFWLSCIYSSRLWRRRRCWRFFVRKKLCHVRILR